MDVSLEPDVKTAFYRVTQEALSNVLQHARASQIGIALRQHHDALTLTISDNGCGFNMDARPSDHFGLGIMAERAELVGASLDVHSVENQGTQVILTYQI
jgi:signal transduction histidine kinase